jgi:hypothetical protein
MFTQQSAFLGLRLGCIGLGGTCGGVVTGNFGQSTLPHYP